MLRAASCLAAICAAFAATSVAFAATEAFDFAVKRAPIAKALNSFAKQAGISIARPRFSYRDGKVRTLKGHYSLEEGLMRLLRGTGYAFEIISDKSVRVFKAPATRLPESKKVTEVQARYNPIEEIMVTTTRRMDAVQKLPYSITAITGFEREHLRALTTGDVIHRMSSIYATKRGEGRNKLIIRGMSDGAFTGRAQSLVSTYFDNTRVTYNAPDPSLRLYDVESIEVLRGPQGTLYGSGAIGGLYRVVTRKPSSQEYELYASAGYAVTQGGEASREVSGVLNIPLVDNRLGLRVVGYYDARGGYIDDERLGRENTNGTDTWGGRASFSLRIDDAWLLTVGANLQKHESDDSQYYNGDRPQLIRDNFLREPRDDRFLQVYATLQADYAWGEVMSTTSWAKREIAQTLDGTRAIEWLVGFGENFPSPFETTRDITTVTNETHVNSAPGGRLEWLVGTFLSNRTEQSLSELSVPGVEFFSDMIEPTEVIYSELLDDDIEEVAFFGELTFFFTEKLSLTGGLRWFRYDGNARSAVVDLGLAVDSDATGAQKKSGWTPKLVLSYQTTDNLLLYGQVSEGYRVGGINLAGVSPLVIVDGEIQVDEDILFDDTLDNFESDELTNYELGVKATLFGGRLTANLSGFLADWRKIQSHQFYEGLPDVGNVGDARIHGAEIDLRVRPTPDLELQANASVSESRLTRTEEHFFAEIGDPLPGAPKYSVGASARYGFSVSASLQGMISADYAYTSGADLLFDKVISPRNDPYHLANLRFAVAGLHWQLTAYANNLLASKSNVFAFGNPLALAEFDFFSTTNQYTPLRPRTFGIELSYRY